MKKKTIAIISMLVIVLNVLTLPLTIQLVPNGNPPATIQCILDEVNIKN